ncbi:LrgB family protein [Cohnella thailandensis]|uniref:LrgB family protein n=1 Tax=Cohnella thailandensis TaxID=557557 RepID=A0A841SL40_9BACL|nr:LrgB family protein [Cohnella thailandensis]MBB6632624.1 LrgB family protein [Cohnella thailandensis]MBP1975688.1 putative murein hydrolase (TIGR00659 family) [Cohnella thailandensis]
MIASVFWLVCTIAVYLLSKRLYRKYTRIYLTPLIVTPAVLLVAIALLKVPYPTYERGAGLLSDLVGPATIALAVTLYKHVKEMKRNAGAIIVSVCFGAVAAVLTTVGLSRLFGLSAPIADSLAPRSATTPIAMSISSHIGGLPTITAVATLVTGIMSMIMGPLVVKAFRIRTPLARGVLFGTSSHSSGVSKALEYDDATGSIAAIAMMVTAFVTLLAAPWVTSWL